MAKDPAVLWYWNDWQGGTATFTRHLKGCYIDLLHAQFNSGRLSLAEIKTVLGADFGQSWPTLQKKFMTDDRGLFYNQRMEIEKEKRKKFTEGRAKNLSSKKSPHMDAHMVYDMGSHMDNENGNGDPIIIKKDDPASEGWRKWPTAENCGILTGLEVDLTIEFIQRLKQQLLTKAQVNEFWQAFALLSFTGKKFYENREDAIQHFRNWLKNQDGNKPQTGTVGNNGKLGTSEARIKAAPGWGRGTVEKLRGGNPGGQG